MIPAAGIFRGGFLIIILLWYSSHVWRAMDQYFRDEFKKYLEEEYKKNKHLKDDVMGIKESTEANKVGITDSVLNGDGKFLETFAKSEQRKDINNDHITDQSNVLYMSPKSMPSIGKNVKTKPENSGKHPQQKSRLGSLIEEEYCSLSPNDVKNDCDE